MSLFRRVTRYRVSPTQNPQENRLTEVTAAVLENVDGFGVAFVGRMLGDAFESATVQSEICRNRSERALWRVEAARLAALLADVKSLGGRPRLRVTTQRVTTSAKFVDLELQLSPSIGARGKTLLFWVEVKHGADVHGSQLTDYLVDIASEGADVREVLLLAPRQTMSKLTGVPDKMPKAEWQSVANEVRHQLKARSRQSGVAVERFLLDEYLTYLDEEGLMDEEALTAEHAFVLSALLQTEQVVAKLIELADTSVQQHWGPRASVAGGEKKPTYGAGFWATYSTGPNDTHDDAWQDGAFEWGMYEDTYRDEPRNAVVLGAGVTFFSAKGNPARLSDNAQWLEERRAGGYEYLTADYWRLFRYRYPEELLVARELDQQAEVLAGWVIEAFEALRANPPTH